MVNKKIAEMFNFHVKDSGEGSITIPTYVFIRNPEALQEIQRLVLEEANRLGVSFYLSTVVSELGVIATWAKTYGGAVPHLESSEDLVGDGLTYILKKVG